MLSEGNLEARPEATACASWGVCLHPIQRDGVTKVGTCGPQPSQQVPRGRRAPGTTSGQTPPGSEGGRAEGRPAPITADPVSRGKHRRAACWVQTFPNTPSTP